MSTIQSPPPVIVNPVPPQTFDPKDIVQAANGIISGDGKGFMPLTDFPPTKPYEDWQTFLEKQRETLNQERARLESEDPKTFFEEQVKKLETEKSRLEQRHESDLETRLSDLEQGHTERLTDREKHHSDEITQRDGEIRKLESKTKDLEAENNSFISRILSDNNQRIDDNRQLYEARIEDLKQQNAELREILQAANQEAWDHCLTYSQHVQNVIKDRESEHKVSDFLRGTLKLSERSIFFIAFLIILLTAVLALIISLMRCS